MEFFENYWKKCNICKAEIGYNAKYFVCNVSTCTRKRTGLSFCSVSCWDAHLPDMRHKEAWAEERTSPSKDLWKKILAGEAEEERPKKEAVIKEEEFKHSPFTPKTIIRRPKS